MKINYEKFKQELKRSTKETYLGCIERLKLSEIAGYALYSDESAMTMSVSCNTFDHLEEQTKKHEGFYESFKWHVGDWKYEMINSKAFDHLTEQLNSVDFNSDKKIIEHRNRIYSIAVEVLEELKVENLFTGLLENFILMFGVSDLEDIQLELEFVKRLNNPIQFAEYEKWRREEEE